MGAVLPVFAKDDIADRLSGEIEAAADSSEVVAWRGQGLSAWLKKQPLQCKDVRLEEGQLKGVVAGRDSQLYADLSLRPLGNQVVRLRLKAGRGGRGQLFWICEGDKTATEAQQKAFAVVGDGKWHDYRIRPGWTGKPLRALRLDLPPECADDTPFAIDSVVIAREGQEIAVDTAKTIGVAFRLKMPPGQHYCTLVWSGDGGPGEFGFEAVRDVFGRKPADGWPVNYAPEDVGLTCPQRSLYE